MDNTPGIPVLYLSYDGLTDNLGRSQIIPYINGLQTQGFEMTVISVDKKEQYRRRSLTVIAQLSDGVDWISIPYHKNPPLISTLYDLRAMSTKALNVVKEKGIKLVHVRSYPPMSLALMLKAKFGVQVIFDMRGFYPEERMEGGIWSAENLIHRRAFKELKKKEAQYFTSCDHAISLTHKGKDVLVSSHGMDSERITVIPCCADFNHFKTFPSNHEKSKYLNVVYLGSLGTWYLVEEMIRLFSKIKEQNPYARLEIYSSDELSGVYHYCDKYSIPHSAILAKSAEREELPHLLAKADLSIFLIKPSYSKQASSPTKLAELLACGIPVLCNSEVGDLQKIGEQCLGVYTFELSSMDGLDVGAIVRSLISIDSSEIRLQAQQRFSLNKGCLTYGEVYKSLLNNTPT